MLVFKLVCIKRLYWHVEITKVLSFLEDTCQAAIDLMSISSPFSGATTGARNDYNTSCGGNGPERIFFLDLDPGYKLTIAQTSNTYDSRHQLAYGGSCPGTNTVNCLDDPDTEAISWENRLDTAERVYFMIDAYTNEDGPFTMEWEIEGNTFEV